MEQVDILIPPTFQKSGNVKSLKQAWEDEDWIGTFNLWVIQNNPVPSIVYQQRSSNSSWAPNKLDVTAGGHYEAGEEIMDGLREVKEELGKSYREDDLTYLGKKLHVSPDIHQHERKNVVDVFFVIDNSPLSSYIPERKEVYAIFSCPIEELKKVHSKKEYSFEAKGLNNQGKELATMVTKESFPFNWDNYHFKIALLADRFVKGEEYLLY